MTYNEINYRSVLEAKYAYLFDWLGIPHIYEEDRIGNYIPDFTIYNHELVEVKPYINPNKKVWEHFYKNYLKANIKPFPIIYQLYGQIVNYNGIGILGCEWRDGKSELLKIVYYKDKYLILPITELINEEYLDYNFLKTSFEICEESVRGV